jgi:hypothetical protein
VEFRYGGVTAIIHLAEPVETPVANEWDGAGNDEDKA